MSDARYTAKIMKKLDFDRVKKFCSIDTFTIPESRKDEVYPVSYTHLAYF